MDGLRLEGQNLGQFLVIKYIKNYSYQNMSIIKVVLLFLYSSMKKKIRKIRLIFDMQKWFWKPEVCYLAENAIIKRSWNKQAQLTATSGVEWPH